MKICRECFYAVFEEEIHRVVVDNQLFKPGERIAIGASGGKGEYLILCDFSSDNDVTAHEVSINQLCWYVLKTGFIE